MELTRFQKILLAVLAAMLVLFSVLMALFRTHPGVLFEESLLKIEEREGGIVYSGRAHGTPVAITVTYPTNVQTDVEFTIGDQIHDRCAVTYPTKQLRTEHGDSVDGILVEKNGSVLFEGGYDPEDEFGWYDQNGAWAPSANLQIRVYAGGDPWSGYETTAGDAVRFALGPDTAAHGHPAPFAMAVFLTVLLAAQIVFHEEFFRWRHWAARDPEPTDGYLALERAGWLILTVIIAGIYLAALTQIY